MNWQVELYETEGGRCPVGNFINDIKDGGLRARLMAYLAQLKEQGRFLGKPAAKKITKDLWELRIKYKGNHYRILYFFVGHKIILVHAFEKKSQKIAKHDKELAEMRKRDWERRFLKNEDR